MPKHNTYDLEARERKRILLRLANGVTTREELNRLATISKRRYSASSTLKNFITWQCFNELGRRLRTNVFSEIGRNYPLGYKRFAIHAEYHNTKLFIELINNMVNISQEYGDITNPIFYGIADAGYLVTMEAAIHILLRHNETMNGFINEDSRKNGYNPSSFSFGMVADSMKTLFMSLHAIEDNDWIREKGQRNLICHVSVYGRPLTIVRNGNTKEIKTFYPRNDHAKLAYIELEKHPEQRRFRKVVEAIA